MSCSERDVRDFGYSRGHFMIASSPWAGALEGEDDGAGPQFAVAHYPTGNGWTL